MAIISRNKTKKPTAYKSAQFRYAIVYVLVTFVALLFLNIYCSKISQELFYTNKKTSMIEICQMAASDLASLEVLNKQTIGSTVENLVVSEKTRIIVSDQNGVAIYDSSAKKPLTNKYVLFPEIIKALEINDVFTWKYKSGTMQSRTAIPIISYGTLLGCIYMTENDAEQGALIASIQNYVLLITLLLEIIVIVFSFFSSKTYGIRLRKILSSIRTVRDGDYSHKVELRGNDELNQLGDNFNDLIGRLQTSENKRNQFVSDASHELNTPLAAIKLLSDSILQNNMDTETIKEFVGDIGNEAERLNRMSHKLLELTRIDSNASTDSELISPAQTIKKVVRILSANAAEKNICVHTELDEKCLIQFRTDDFYQVIFNLVENGIKYTGNGGTLHITLKSNKDNAIIVISDTGVGIPEEALAHIFDRFYRVDKARSRASGGSGLGLSIVRNIINQNKGKIEVESTVGIGTAFTLTLPVYLTKEDNL